MELSDKLKYCAICRNSKRDIERGIVCGLTNEKPVFDKHCADLQASAHEIAELEESLIGGMRIRIGDHILDTSISTKLGALTDALKKS